MILTEQVAPLPKRALNKAAAQKAALSEQKATLNSFTELPFQDVLLPL